MALYKSCPFCGNRNVNPQKWNGIDFWNCKQCGACVSFKDINGKESQAIDTMKCWNRRASQC